MSERPELYGGFVIGPDGDPHNVLAAFNGNDTYIADNVGQSENHFWNQHENHNHYGRYDGRGGDRGNYTGPGA